MNPPLKWPGGKQPLASIIQRLAGTHQHRVILFGGGLGEFWSWPHEGVSEVVNDVDCWLQDLWSVIRDPTLFSVFQRCVNGVPFGRSEWEWARDYVASGRTGDRVTDALAYFVLIRQSFAGMKKQFTALTKSRTRRGMNGEVSAWLSCVEDLPAAHERMKRVVVECLPAVELIRREDGPHTLFYADPPYYGIDGLYEHGMTPAQHVDLLGALLDCKGRVLLSGYRCPLYDDALTTWRRVDVEVGEQISRDTTRGKRTESLWMNWNAL